MNTPVSENNTVAVAVSGGADSLYSLVRLRERDIPVIALHGIFLKPGDESALRAAAVMRARLAQACAGLGIPLHVIDLTGHFAELVIRPFVESYALGRTPNPCALCNARIKFGLLLEAALGLGADRLATGHYAALEQHRADEPPALYQGADPDKDQSYFLALVPLEALSRAVFPLAGDRKTSVLEELARLGLTPPQPGESQEVCFVPDDEYRDFVPGMAERFGIALPGPGPMLLKDGSRVGTHKGLWRYTEGQRRGLGIGWKEPLHVLAKERRGNVLRLGGKGDMRFSGITCEQVNVLLPPECWPETVLVKTRYRERPKPARAALVPGKGGGIGLSIRFEEPENAVAPGQIAAVYAPPDAQTHKEKRLRLVAGGVIVKSHAPARL